MRILSFWGSVMVFAPGGQIDRIAEQVGVRVGDVLARGIVVMRAVPGQVRALDVALA